MECKDGIIIALYIHMARKRRIYGRQGSTYSIHCRINDGEIMRFQDREVAKLFFEVIRMAKQKFKFSIHLHTLMGNHYHLKLKLSGDGESISKVMHWINFMVAVKYNQLTGHKGRLWRERFKSYVLNDLAYFLNTAAYIIENPRRAGISSVDNYPFGTGIYLYQLVHPFPEFEQYRGLFEEPYAGYYDQIKRIIAEREMDKKACAAIISMAPRSCGRPKK